MPNSKIDVEALISRFATNPADIGQEPTDKDPSVMLVNNVRRICHQLQAEIDRRGADKAEAVADAILSASIMGVAWRIDLRGGVPSDERSLGGLNKHALTEVIKAALSASAGGKS